MEAQHTPAEIERPLRLCGLCQMWNRKPCGDGCAFDLRNPTWEQVLAAHDAALTKAQSTGGGNERP